jgi:hypothetical protein
MNVLLIGNDQTLLVEGLQDEITGDYINNATVTATIKDKRDVAVAGQSWPATLAYVDDSNGNYRGNLEDGLELVQGRVYWVEITANAGSDIIAFWRFRLAAMYREP